MLVQLRKFISAILGEKSLYETTGNQGCCIHHLGLNICLDEHSYHDSRQACLIEGMVH